MGRSMKYKDKYEYAKSKEHGEYMNRPEVVEELKRRVRRIKEYRVKREEIRERNKARFEQG